VFLMHRRWLLIVTAYVEVGTALFLLFLPSIPLVLLLGVSLAAPEAVIMARVTGAALLAIGVASYLARSDQHSPAQLGVLTGVLIYDVAAAALLAYAGSVSRMAGIGLWPAVVLHAALAVWCVACFWVRPRGEGAEVRGDRSPSASNTDRVG
jgi:hypothetical protein